MPSRSASSTSMSAPQSGHVAGSGRRTTSPFPAADSRNPRYVERTTMDQRPVLTRRQQSALFSLPQREADLQRPRESPATRGPRGLRERAGRRVDHDVLKLPAHVGGLAFVDRPKRERSIPPHPVALRFMSPSTRTAGACRCRYAARYGLEQLYAQLSHLPVSDSLHSHLPAKPPRGSPQSYATPPPKEAGR